MKSKSSCFFRQSEWEGTHELTAAPADEQVHFPISFINQIFIKFLGFQENFFQKALLVAEGTPR
jgi:hypothetical protein